MIRFSAVPLNDFHQTIEAILSQGLGRIGAGRVVLVMLMVNQGLVDGACKRPVRIGHANRAPGSIVFEKMARHRVVGDFIVGGCRVIRQPPHVFEFSQVIGYGVNEPPLTVLGFNLGSQFTPISVEEIEPVKGAAATRVFENPRGDLTDWIAEIVFIGCGSAAGT